MRRLTPLAVVLCLVSACIPAVDGDAAPAHVIGVAQAFSGDEALEVTLLALVDPAPTYAENVYGSQPEEGARLVAVQFKVTNSAPEDQLVGPGGRVAFHASDGKTYGEHPIDTSAGAMLDQLRLAPKQTMVGYLTAVIPDGVSVTSVDFGTDSAAVKEVLTWDTTGQAVTEPVKPPARTGQGPATYDMGARCLVAGTYGPDEFRLIVTATKVTDPAQTSDPRVRVGPHHRLLGVDFTVHNDGKIPYSDVEAGIDLRGFMVQNKEDEAYTSHTYGITEEHGMPLVSGGDDTWHVLFVVPADFVPDRVGFAPSFGDKVATVWAT